MSQDMKDEYMVPKKPREWKCQYNPETGELTYGYKHGCTDGFEDIHVIEHSAYETFRKKCEKSNQLLEQADKLAYCLKAVAFVCVPHSPKTAKLSILDRVPRRGK